jgi:predicted branched-subunit amino acid permease
MTNYWAFDFRYFLGVAVGLIIAWVTGALAYYKTGDTMFLPQLVELEAIVSIVMIVIAIGLKVRKK